MTLAAPPVAVTSSRICVLLAEFIATRPPSPTVTFEYQTVPAITTVPAAVLRSLDRMPSVAPVPPRIVIGLATFARRAAAGLVTSLIRVLNWLPPARL